MLNKHAKIDIISILLFLHPWQDKKNTIKQKQKKLLDYILMLIQSIHHNFFLEHEQQMKLE